MLVVSRKPGESVVLEGDEGDITITVVHIRGRRVTLKVEINTPDAGVNTEIIATRSEVLPLGAVGSMTIVDVRGELCRLGFELIKGVEVLRKEVFEAIRAPRAAAAAIASTGKSVVVGVDQAISIGAAVTVTPTDLDTSGTRVLVRGELVGGPDDGLRIDEPREMRIGGVIQVGTLITITLAAVAGPRARFLIAAPPHMAVAIRT